MLEAADFAAMRYSSHGDQNTEPGVWPTLQRDGRTRLVWHLVSRGEVRPPPPSCRRLWRPREARVRRPLPLTIWTQRKQAAPRRAERWRERQDIRGLRVSPWKGGGGWSPNEGFLKDAVGEGLI